jgi:hypothetical protein
MMHGHEKSDSVIVAVKPANKAMYPAAEQSAMEPVAAEPVEPRTGTKGNANQQSTCRTQSRISVSQALECMRQAIAVWTRGGSRMRESRTSGSVRGALGQRASLPLRAPAASWCDPAGERPAQVRSSVRLVASVAWPLATVVAKRTQRLHGVWD